MEADAGPSWKMRVLGVLILLFAICGAAPVLSARFGHPFMPSEEYSDSYATVVAVALALAAGGFSFYIFAGTDLFLQASRRRGEAAPSYMKLTLLAIFSPLLIGFLAYEAVIGGFPMAIALVVGEDVALRYTAKDATRWSDSKCRPMVELDAMPMMFNEACFVPEEFRSQLRPGMKIELLGRGTGYGVFYDRFRIAAS